MRHISDLTISESPGFCYFYDPSFINFDCERSIQSTLWWDCWMDRMQDMEHQVFSLGTLLFIYVEYCSSHFWKVSRVKYLKLVKSNIYNFKWVINRICYSSWKLPGLCIFRLNYGFELILGIWNWCILSGTRHILKSDGCILV